MARHRTWTKDPLNPPPANCELESNFDPESMSMQPDKTPIIDPVYESSLRESKWIVIIWAINFAWVIGYCTWSGYPDPDEPLSTVWGMPSWVFWGVFVPWIVAAAVSSWFALTKIKDHPLPEGSLAQPHQDGAPLEEPKHG